MNTYRFNYLKVLVVDDNRSAALAIAMLLEREGHFAEAVYDGGAAIKQLKERRLACECGFVCEWQGRRVRDTRPVASTHTAFIGQ